MEKRKVNKKKNNWDSLLPRTGLNPGFLPDKGKAGVDSFNHMNAASFAASEACCEELKEWLVLDEAKINRSDYIITRMCFAGRRLDDLLNTKVDNHIDPAIIPNKEYGPAIYDPENLEPTTIKLMSRLDDHPGSGNKEAELLGKIVHHIFLATTKGVPGEIIKYISIQDHTRLHNMVTSILTPLLAGYGKDDITKYKKQYSINLENKTIDGYARSLCLDAWIIRELYIKYIDPNTTSALYNKHQIELGKAAGKFFVDHPEYLTYNDDNIIKIKTASGDKRINLIISSIDQNQIRELTNHIINGYLKEYPDFLESDFIGYVDLDNNKKSSTDISDFKKLFDNELNESLDELKPLSKIELRNYLEHNYDKYAVNNKLMIEMINRYLTPELKQELFGTKYVNDNEKAEMIWKSSKARRLKQFLIAQYVRYLLSTSEFGDVEIWTTAKPTLDENDLLYKLKPADIIIRYGNAPGEYEIDLKRDIPITLEQIYSAIKDKKLIRVDIKDPHFLDASGNIVPGVKFVYDALTDYNKTSAIINILTASNCDVESINKIIVDKHLSYNSKQSIGDMLDKNNIKNVDTVEIVGNILGSKMFSSLKCNKISFNNFTSSMLPPACFKYLDCPKFDIPASVIKLGEECFAYSYLKEIVIPSTVLDLDDGCFKGCNHLTIYFDIEKSELDKSRSKWGTGKYAGYNTQWGKMDVAKIIYGYTTTIESLTKKLTESLSYPLAQNNTYNLYKISGKEEYSELAEYLADKGLDTKTMIFPLLGDSYWYDNNAPRYFIENIDDIAKSKLYEENTSHLHYLEDGLNSKEVDLKTALSQFDEPDLREIILFSNSIPKLKNLSEILKAQKVTAKTPFLDDKYYVGDDTYNASRYMSENNLLKAFLRYLDNGDYSAAFELADIQYPEFDDFKDDITKVLESEKAKNILDDFNIKQSDAINSLNNFGELHDIIKISAISSLINTVVKSIKKFISTKISDSDGVIIDFNEEEAKVHLVYLYQEYPEINLSNVDDYADAFIDKKIKNNINSSYSYSSVSLDPTNYYAKKNLIKDNIEPYALDAEKFLNNLENNLKYYYK